MNDESTPKGAHESATTDLMVTAGSLSLDDRIAAFEAGRQQGKAERIEVEVEDRARAMLVEWSRESRDMSTAYAAKVGPNWAALVADAGERE
jgi:hypothetical protein